MHARTHARAFGPLLVDGCHFFASPGQCPDMHLGGAHTHTRTRTRTHTHAHTHNAKHALRRRGRTPRPATPMASSRSSWQPRPSWWPCWRGWRRSTTVVSRTPPKRSSSASRRVVDAVCVFGADRPGLCGCKSNSTPIDTAGRAHQPPCQRAAGAGTGRRRQQRAQAPGAWLVGLWALVSAAGLVQPGHNPLGLNPPKSLPPLQVFISFRVLEALPQALGLMRALEAKGVAAFCSSAPGHIPPGTDWCAPPI